MRDLILQEMGEDVVKAFETLVVALGVALWLPMTGQAAEESAPSAKNQTPTTAYITASKQCLNSVVKLYDFCTKSNASPIVYTMELEQCLRAVVSLYNFCSNPHEAAIEPPPTASLNPPCNLRDLRTVYKPASGCGD